MRVSSQVYNFIFPDFHSYMNFFFLNRLEKILNQIQNLKFIAF